MKRKAEVEAARTLVRDLLSYARAAADRFEPLPGDPSTPGRLRLEEEYPEETFDVRLDPYGAMGGLRVQAQTLSWVLGLDPEFDGGPLPGNGPVDT